MFKRLFPSSLVVIVIASWLSSLDLVPAQSAKKEGGDSRPALTDEVKKWAEDGFGKLTEDDVITKLGRPDFVENPIDPDSNTNPVADIAITWQDVSLIEVVVKDGKVKQIIGRFSPHIKSKQVTLMNFRKLKTGATKLDVEQVLGLEDSSAELSKGTIQYEWGAKRILKIYFKDRKASGTAWHSRG